MSVVRIPEKGKIRLWGKSAGRCQYPGCNKILWRDCLNKVEFNTAYIAHIIADKPSGPRGDIKLSKILTKDQTFPTRFDVSFLMVVDTLLSSQKLLSILNIQ